MAALTRSALASLTANRVREEVPVPELGEGVTVFVRVMTLAEVARVRKVLNGDANNGLAAYGLMVSIAACEEGGAPLWPTAAEAEALPYPAVERIVAAVSRANALGGDEAQTAVEAARKN